MEIEGTEASREVGTDSTSGVSSQHLAPPPRLSAAPLRCCISTQFWVSVCLAEPWIIKDKRIFNACVVLCWGCCCVSSVLCGLGLAWMKQLGLEVKGRKLSSVKRGEERVGLISAVSELRAPTAAACCQRGAQGRVRNAVAPVRSRDWRMRPRPLTPVTQLLPAAPVTTRDRSV